MGSLKTEISRMPIPVPRSLANKFARGVSAASETVLVGGDGGQLSTWALERAVRTARAKVDGLPDGFRYHDLRHYFASLLIASGADVKTVQARLRHASAKTTLDTYGHLWPDRDESTRAAVGAVLQDRADLLRTAASLR
jgi:integrase